MSTKTQARWIPAEKGTASAERDAHTLLDSHDRPAAIVYEGTQKQWHWYTLPVSKHSPVGSDSTFVGAQQAAEDAIKAAMRPHIVMKVRIEAEVVVEVDHTPRGLLQSTVIDATEQAVARTVEAIPALHGAVTSLSVSRGTNGYAYFGKGREVLTESADPFTAVLSDVLKKAVQS